MIITTHRFTLVKRHPLTISRGTTAQTENLLAQVEHDGITGIGEMAPVSLGSLTETPEAAEAAIQIWADALAGCAPWETQRIDAILDGHAGGRAARAALDCALYDWLGKRWGVPVWMLLGLDRSRISPTSLTIGIDLPDVVRERVPEVLERTGARILKVKLGSPAGPDADREIFAAAQESATRPVVWRVDANGGWSVDAAKSLIRWLADREVEMVEQPLPRGQEMDLPAVHRNSPLPIFADESVLLASDIPPLASSIDGVNLKLMKCGGLREALRIIHTARAHHLRVMIGCMSESSLAITAAAHLSPLADALDLDSHLNLIEDPFRGAALVDGRIIPGDGSGMGASPV